MGVEDLLMDVYSPNPDGNDVDRWLISTREMTELWYRQFLFFWGAHVQTPALRFALIRSENFNAWASTQDNIDTVGINLGLLFLTRDLFDRVFSHPDIFSPNQETNRDFYPALATDIYLEQALQAHRPYAPTNAQRVNRADFCFQVGTLWVFTHELCHIWLGHCDYLRSKGELPHISEDDYARSTLPGRDRQAMEDMADSVATAFLANGFLQTDRDLSKPERQGRLFAFFFAITCVLIKFQGLGLGRLDDANATHPPPLYRSSQFISLTVSFIARWTNDFSLEEVQEIALEASGVARTAVATLLGTEPPSFEQNKVNERFTANRAVLTELTSRASNAIFRDRDGIASDFERWNSLAPQEPCLCGSNMNFETCHAPAVEFWRKFLAGPTSEMR